MSGRKSRMSLEGAMVCRCGRCQAEFVAADPQHCPSCGRGLSGWWVPELAVADGLAPRSGERSPVWDMRELVATVGAQHAGYMTESALCEPPDRMAASLWARRLRDTEVDDPWDDRHDPMGPWRRRENRFVYRDLYLVCDKGPLWVSSVRGDGGTVLLDDGTMTPEFARWLDEVREVGLGSGR